MVLKLQKAAVVESLVPKSREIRCFDNNMILARVQCRALTRGPDRWVYLPRALGVR